MARRKPKQYKLVPWSAWPALPPWHGLVSPLVANVFAELRISASLWISGDFWHVFHHSANVGAIESNLGVADRRYAYNGVQLELVKRRRRLVVGEHAGFFDLFVPVGVAGQDFGVLVAGPFSKAYPTSDEIQERWRAFTGSPGRLTDPQFAEYVAMTLGTLTLSGEQAALFEKLMTRFATLLCDRGDASALASEALALGRTLLEARVPERMWDAAHRLVDEKSAGAWPIQGRTILLTFGSREAAHVIVALLGGGPGEGDPLAQWLRKAEFQRECVALAQRFGGMLAGRVGDHGVSFILDEERGRRPRTRARISELVAEAAARAKRLGFSLHAGVGQVPEGTSLPVAYRAARWAAEKALAEGSRVVYGDPRPEPSHERLRQIRDRLEKSIEQRPDLLMPRFDQYVDAVLAHAAYRIEVARTELEIAVERLVAPLLAANLLEQKTVSELRATQDRATAEAQTVNELAMAYRGMVAGIESALRNPIVARQERSTRRAMAYVREHLAEPLTLKRGARVAGLAPSHFARLFMKSEGMSFAAYVRSQRLQRARDMLQTTSLSVEQVQKLCGFQSRASFYRVFKRAIGRTPGHFRESA